MAKTPPPADPDWDDKQEEAKSDQSVPGEDPILTHAEIEAIRKQAREEILADRRKNAKGQFLAAEKARLLCEEGMTTGSGQKDQIVRITIDLAEYAGNILINGRPYWHGHTYTVPRHVAENLREIMQRTHQHQDDIDGKGLKSHYAKARNTTLSPVKGSSNAPTKPDGTVAA